MRPQPLVEIRRGGWPETRHRGWLIVVDCEGNEVYAYGDPDHEIYVRSALKPFVAGLIVASGAADAFGLTPAELAVIAGSHSGTDADAELVLGMLTRCGAGESDLTNGTDGPSDEATRTRFAAAGTQPGPVRQMCSGEHAGLILMARHFDWPHDGYWEPEHPAQRAVSDMVVRVFGESTGDTSALDNCALPTWRVSLRTVAQAYGWLARPDRLPAPLRDLEEPWRRVRDAMLDHPVRISGEGQLDTDLSATDRAFIAKEGAEGLLGIGSVATGLGIALSIEDGDMTRRAASVVAIATLSQLRLLDPESEGRLRERYWPSVVDSRGRQAAVANALFHVPRAE